MALMTSEGGGGGGGGGVGRADDAVAPSESTKMSRQPRMRWRSTELFAQEKLLGRSKKDEVPTCSTKQNPTLRANNSMSTSQKVTKASVQRRVVPEPIPKGFRAAWLKSANETFVIDRSEWNTEPVPARQAVKARMSVKWDDFSGGRFLDRRCYGVEIAGVIIRHCFGIVGCIVPVACSPEFDSVVFAFTLAGPCDEKGRKEFYIASQNPSLEANKLLRCSPGYSSVADFHLNRMPASNWVPVAPLAGGKEAAKDEFYKCGYFQRKKKALVNLGDIDFGDD
ncbi:hypothetical protein C8R43DRAFT_954524 [Mycena crocata]|nr:hypothetical protein C8R43DRAFT_954524 [Mycena crocata]